MNPVLLAALLQQFVLPEVMAWLASRKGTTITDADILTKLGVDEATGISIGEAFLASTGGL